MYQEISDDFLGDTAGDMSVLPYYLEVPMEVFVFGAQLFDENHYDGEFTVLDVTEFSDEINQYLGLLNRTI